MSSFKEASLRLAVSMLLATALCLSNVAPIRAQRPALESTGSISGLSAQVDERGIVLQWHGPVRRDQLGFNVYRIQSGNPIKINDEIIPGGVFNSSADLTIQPTRSFAFFDLSGNAGSIYLVESILTNGERETTASVAVSTNRVARKVFVNELHVASQGSVEPTYRSYPAAAERNSQTGTLEDQWAIANQTGLKIGIKQDGWYRVTQADAAAAGFNPAVDIRNLRLFTDGREVSILTNKSTGQFTAGDYFEFFGQSIDKPTSNTRVYYLTAGTQAGSRIRGELRAASDGYSVRTDEPLKRVIIPLTSRWFSFIFNFLNGVSSKEDRTIHDQPRPTESSTTTPLRKAKSKKKNARKVTEKDLSHAALSSTAKNFTYAVERKDRLVYFSSLLNGDAENYFGQVISTNPVSLTLAVPNPDLTAPTFARLDVALQGVGLVQHQIDVSFNSSPLGTLSFFGLEKGVQTFSIPLSLLANGNNTVRFERKTAGDVSIVDYVRVTYPHLLRADNNTLQFALRRSQSVTIDGFSSPSVRVIDVTDPLNPSISSPTTQPSGAGYQIQVDGVSGTGKARVLYAMPASQVNAPASVTLNQPSSLNASSNGADLLLITHKNFSSSLTPLINLRQSEGLAVSVIDIEDIYDEFGFGVHGPQPIKSFLSRANTVWSKKPRYVLLVGDASLDPKNYSGLGEFDLVPTKLVDATFNETSSDDWLVDFDNDGIPDVPVGRLPVRTVSEASLAISKIVSFTPVDVPQSALLIADDPTGYYFNFETANDQVQALLPSGMPVDRINRRVETDPHTAVVANFNSGPSLVSYTGHGNVNTWMGSSIFSSNDAAKLTNAASIVISQIYGGGGEAGAILRNDFIELFNRGKWPVKLAGWSVQYATDADATWQVTALPDVVLSPGKYFLIKQAQGAGGTTNLPTPDAQGTVNLNGAAGKVALLNVTTPLTGTGCPLSANVVDLVGYGGVNCSLGSAAAMLSNTTAAIRSSAGCTNTRTNSADFSAATPAPRNSATASNNCVNAKLPLSFVVVMDCLNGYFQDPLLQGMAETLMNAPNGGAVAVFASSGLTLPDGQHAMTTQLFTLLYGSQSMPLGDAVKIAKGATVDLDVRRTWILFGDPSMRIR